MFGSRIAHRSGPNLTDTRRAAFFGTYHFEASRPNLSAEYWAHRREHFPPDHGELAIYHIHLFLADFVFVERKEGELYEAGFKLFGYSSPFTKPAGAAGVAEIVE